MTPLKSQAIQTALLGDWKNAASLNQELLKENPEDIETLNRLAFAYSVLGKVKDAQSTYQKVLKLDNQNPIATKNLKRLTEKTLKNGFVKHPYVPSLAMHKETMFLEESGKTKVVELVNSADPKVISILMSGEFLNIRIKRLKIFILTSADQYIGMLPEDIGKRLIKFINAGNCYQVCVKSVYNKKVSIFIKETKRAKRYKFQPSFLSSEKITLKHYKPQKEDVAEDENHEE